MSLGTCIDAVINCSWEDDWATAARLGMRIEFKTRLFILDADLVPRLESAPGFRKKLLVTNDLIGLNSFADRN